jgi:hypothetical protein
MAPNPLKGYDDTYLDCRDLRHVWRSVGYWREPDGIVARLLRCQRCETERTDRWDRTSFDRHPSRYHYAKGYEIAMADGQQRTDAHDVRAEAVRRATVYANESSMLDSLMKGRK